MSFGERIRRQIKENAKRASLTDGLVNGTYVIMRKLKGYTHFDFLRNDFYAVQFFLLLELINKEFEAEKKQMKKIRSKRGMR